MTITSIECFSKAEISAPGEIIVESLVLITSHIDPPADTVFCTLGPVKFLHNVHNVCNEPLLNQLVRLKLNQPVGLGESTG